MIDVKKLLELTSEERDVLRELLRLEDEAEKVEKLVPITWKFEMKVTEIELTTITRDLGCRSWLMHDGRWIVDIENEKRVVCIDKAEIYKIFEAEYLEQNNLLTEGMDDCLIKLAQTASCFRYFWDATKEQARNERIFI